uniref:SH3 domain-containing protein n=1 Tax=Meloidogyne javanica TaxID=6303 RepID=A0A915MIY5_MELJA
MPSCTSSSPSSLQQKQHPQSSFSPNSGGSTSSPNASTGSVNGRPLRVAQLPPLATAFTQPAPSTSFPVASCNGNIFKDQKQLHTPSSFNSKQKHPQLPTKNSISNSSNQRLGGLSYTELLELARNQQRQIEANEAELDERRKAVALFGVARKTAGSEREQQQNAQILMSNIRSQIDRDEKELARELKQLENDYGNDEKELRKVFAKVDTLRGQLENLYMKRAAASDIEKRFLLNEMSSSSSPKKNVEGRSSSSNTFQNERRPKASVSPFNKYEKGRDIPDCSGTTTINHSPSKNHQIPTISGQGTAKIQWRRELPSNSTRQQQYNNIQQQTSPTHLNINGSTGGLLPPAVDKISLRRNSINQAKRNSLVSEGGDEHVQALLLAELRRGRSHISFGRSWDSSQLSDEFRTTTRRGEREGKLALFDDSWHKNIRSTGNKGILRERQQNGVLLNTNTRLEPKKQTNRVKIDLVILFLDVAYEGQYEMLVKLASQIDDISVSNSEGLTALHYAICATASCGNLPMIKLLIEYGACPIATTISKSETVAQIFDDSNENAAVGIEYMNFVEECMGVVNDSKVYAAYSYSPQRDDELSFEEGDELKVIRKCEYLEEEEENTKKVKTHLEEECDEHCWWLCEHTKEVFNKQKIGFG